MRNDVNEVLGICSDGTILNSAVNRGPIHATLIRGTNHKNGESPKLGVEREQIRFMSERQVPVMGAGGYGL